MSVDDPVVEAASLIDEGAIVAIKGIGGVHVSCATTNDGPLKRLRETKRKYSQPFAVMAKDIVRATEFAEMLAEERRLLESWRKPIVILKKSERYFLSDLVAPGLDTIGVMLPYTGIHVLLTSKCHQPAIVMTSGNITGLPMSTANDNAFRELSKFVDYFLLHNRDIMARCDDSVVRVVGNDAMFARRSRGWVPTPIHIPMASDAAVVGVGGELRVAGGLLWGNRCYLTQHIGDVDNLETIQFLEAALKNMSSLTGVDLKGATTVRDMHPRYLTSRFAAELASQLDGQLVSVQHHHAHVASLMAEHGVPDDEEVVGVAADGVGYGVDGTAWGGEVLLCTYDRFERVGHLATQPMPGGDLCTKYPLRMCVAMLKDYLEERRVREVLLSWRGPGSLTDDDLTRIEGQMERSEGLAWTSSVGRVLDAFAALTGTCLVRTYEGEPAMRLEAAASRESTGDMKARVPSIDCTNIINTSRFLYDMIGLLHETSLREACRAYQEGLATALAEVAVREATDRGITKIGLTGGAAVNTIIDDAFMKVVLASGLEFMRHRLVPCGDGGIALGQVSVATAKL
jgi:hydrogenase maturation protein HypF